MKNKTAKFSIASLRFRIFAALIDGVILIILYFILSLITGVILRSLNNRVTSLGARFPQMLVMGVTVLYYTWLIGRYGQTPGKYALGIKVVRLNEDIPGYMIAFFRWLGYVLNGITCGAGYLVALFNSRRRGLHDYLAGTKVVSVAKASLWGQIIGILLTVIVILWFLLGLVLYIKGL